jgi:hypothetical protein
VVVVEWGTTVLLDLLVVKEVLILLAAQDMAVEAEEQQDIAETAEGVQAEMDAPLLEVEEVAVAEVELLQQDEADLDMEAEALVF